MAEHDQEFLRGLFLMEAWDTVATVEEGLPRLLEAAPPGEALAPLVVVAHRLKGAAALHGFTGTAELAGLLETVLERARERGGGVEAHGLVVDVLAAIKPVLDGIAASGVEDAAASEAFRAGHPAAFEPDGSAGSPSRRPGDAMLHEVRHFFAEHGDVLAYFGPEAAEHIETITRSLLALEQSGPDPGEAELHALFRAVHTLKGAAYTVGCEAVGWMVHRAEDVLGAVRERRLVWSPAVMDTLFRATDAIKVLLGAPDAPVGDPAAVIEDAVQALASVRVDDLAPAAGASLLEVGGAVDPEAARIEPMAPLPAAEHPPREASSPPEAGRPARTSIRVSVGRLDALMNLVGELVIARSRLERRFRQLERLDGLLTVSRGRMSQTVRDFEGKYLDPHLRFTEDDVAGARPGVPGRDGFAPASALFAELEFDRYDDFNILARTIGELSADLGEIQVQLAAAIRSIEEDTRHVQRLTASLRSEITRSRMVPIGKLFARFPRRVRELAGPSGRAVRLELAGESVEVDNAVIEQIADPLLHLIQNAVVHGIEPEAERLALGKAPEGRLALTAYQRGGTMVVEVEDDGRGIDAGAVRELAVRREMLSPEAASRLGDREVLSLLFLPGFSTAASVTDAAGRGVGLDVVRTNVARVNGEVDVETEPGVGTRFTLRLPIALAISDALMVRAGGETLALPLNAVRQIVTRRPQDIRGAGPSEMVRVEGQLLDLYRLDRLLGLAAAEAGPVRPVLPVLVVRTSGRSFAVAVDAIVGKEEIVIKPLGGLLAGLPPFGGATITGEGRVILLVDPARLLALAEGGIGQVSEPRAAIVPAPAPPVSHSLAGAARRVLLVDDSVSVRRFVGHMLENGGFEVLTANDGAEALERLVDTTVDVVVTDLEMPRVNGYELIENLRRRPSTQEVPVVVLTTRAGEKHWALARRLGVRHYVTKPVDEQAFVRLVTDVAAAAPEVESSGVVG
jgi:chemosensory pili system protein ChpA (sensor histidine kinase/response regulator)